MKNLKLNNRVYLLAINLFFLSGIVYAASQKSSYSILDAIVFFGVFILAVFVEYKTHSGSMHFNTESKKYKNHVLRHHNFFKEGNLYYGSSKDYNYTLNAPLVIVLNIVINVLLPFGILAFIDLEIAYTFLLTGLVYFYINEMLHFYYHIHDNELIVKVTRRVFPFIYAMRKHHLVHHRNDLMEKFNFGITSSIFDYLYKTKHKE